MYCDMQAKIDLGGTIRDMRWGKRWRGDIFALSTCRILVPTAYSS